MAGSWTEFTKDSGMPPNQLSLIEKHSAVFTADAGNAAIPAATHFIKGAFLCGFGESR